jgi:hypothetical protein
MAACAVDRPISDQRRLEPPQNRALHAFFDSGSATSAAFILPINSNASMNSVVRIPTKARVVRFCGLDAGDWSMVFLGITLAGLFLTLA